MKNTTRKFSGKASAMLIGISAIVDNAKEHLGALSAHDTTLTEAYLDKLRQSIDHAAVHILGADNAQSMRLATLSVRAESDSAMRELSFVRLLIRNRFAKDPLRRDELLSNLGFSGLYRVAITRKRHDDISELLLRFDGNLSPELETELLGIGLPKARIDIIRNLAATFPDKKIDQQIMKGHRLELSARDIAILNDLYDEVLGIARVAQKHFKDQPAIKQRFMIRKAAPAPQSKGPGKVSANTDQD